MEELAEILAQIQELAGVGLEGLMGAAEGGAPPKEGAAPPEDEELPPEEPPA